MTISIILWSICFVLLLIRVINLIEVYKQTQRINISDLISIILIIIFIVLCGMNIWY